MPSDIRDSAGLPRWLEILLAPLLWLVRSVSIEVFESEPGEWYWMLVAPDGEPDSDTDGPFPTEAKAHAAARRARPLALVMVVVIAFSVVAVLVGLAWVLTARASGSPLAWSS